MTAPADIGAGTTGARVSAPSTVPAASEAARDPAETLCRSCGLCCDGSLFRAVELAPGDRLPGVAATTPCLAQPCRFHGAGGCGIYAARPGPCRSFICHVLDALRAGRRDRAWAEARIASMRHLLAGLDDALPGEGALYPRAAGYLEDTTRLPDEPRIRARIAVFAEMIGDFRPLNAPDLVRT